MDMQHPVDKRRTDGPRLVARLSQEQMDEEMRWSPCPCPREMDGVDFFFFSSYLSMMARDWSASWMQMISTVLGERKERGRGSLRVIQVVEVCIVKGQPPPNFTNLFLAAMSLETFGGVFLIWNGFQD